MDSQKPEIKEWNDLPMKEWDKLPLKVYEKTLEEIKELFGEYISEIVSVTEKSIKILIGISAFVSAAGTIAVSRPSVLFINATLLIAYIILFYRLYKIIKSRQGHIKGMNPSHIITSTFDKSEMNDVDKEKLIYVNLIEQYMRKVYVTKGLNEKRAKEYDVNFFLAITLVIITSIYVAYILTH